MSTKNISFFTVFVLALLGFSIELIACDCTGSPPGEYWDCYDCQDGVWVLYSWADCGDDDHCTPCKSCIYCYCLDNSDLCDGCKSCEDGWCNSDDDNCDGCEICDGDGNCVDDDDECSYYGYCYSCEEGECVDDNDKCSGCESCIDGYCVDDDYNCYGCKDCVNASCTDNDENCDYCQDCIFGECIDNDNKCMTCQYCLGGACWDDCPSCQECVNDECVHFCDNCDFPKYCANKCVCVECYYGTEDTTTCSSGQSYTLCDCSHNIISPCSSAEVSVVYSDKSLKSCTGPDCDSEEVLCYTTYQAYTTSGGINPLQWCLYSVPPPDACGINPDYPGPGCYPLCQNK